MGSLTFEEARDAFSEQVQGLARGGVDVLWIETISSREEVEAAAAAETGLPVVCNMSFDTNGHTMMGITPAELTQICDHLTLHPVGFGTNCGVGAAEVIACILTMIDAARPGAVLVAKANCGVPEFKNSETRYNGTPEIMAEYARMARDVGSGIIGGCCGTTPAHIRAMRDALHDHEPRGRPDLETVEARLGPVSRGAKGLQAVLPSRPPGRRSSRRSAAMAG